TDPLIGAFEHREVEVFLVSDVVIQHALVGAGVGRDAIDTRAGKAMGGELLLGGLEDAKPHALGVPLPLQNAFCLCQINRSMLAAGQAVARKGRFENECSRSVSRLAPVRTEVQPTVAPAASEPRRYRCVRS